MSRLGEEVVVYPRRGAGGATEYVAIIGGRKRIQTPLEAIPFDAAGQPSEADVLARGIGATYADGRFGRSLLVGPDDEIGEPAVFEYDDAGNVQRISDVSQIQLPTLPDPSYGEPPTVTLHEPGPGGPDGTRPTPRRDGPAREFSGEPDTAAATLPHRPQGREVPRRARPVP